MDMLENKLTMNVKSMKLNYQVIAHVKDRSIDSMS